ncbi:hypothetical protein GYMLUDRAFT_756012 [Collybiopsis luxurians FD-317 M1]|uniref:Ig-like domain-containing protein n=1 Tax=Collybiopsis luxurians FD-317 M1 TaxID=944289 RepID=A0A0D0C4L5_9AGAR|nr:hypothetical protein GYMLUDRAFT_756012 [Collybiopsis luxurians FD-317 M1]
MHSQSLRGFYESDPLQMVAGTSLLKFIVLGPKRWKILGYFLAGCSFEVVTIVFRNLISVLRSPSNADLPAPNHRSLDDYFLEFCTSITREFPTLIEPLSDSGIASLLLSIFCNIDPTHIYAESTSLNGDWAVSRRELLRQATSRLSYTPNPAAADRGHYECDKTTRILDTGVVVSVSLSMMESLSEGEDSNDVQIDGLWKQATRARLRPVLSSALREIWMLLACAGEGARTGRRSSGDQNGEKIDVRRLLICFQILAAIFDINVYAMTTNSTKRGRI